MRTNVQIITVVKDDLLGLLRTLNSVSVQDLRNISLSILIVDGSSNGQIRDSLSGFPNLAIEYEYLKPQGVYSAMNYGLRYLACVSTNPTTRVIFLNAGDFLLESDSLEKLCWKNSHKKIVIGQAVIYNPNRNHETLFPISNLGTDNDLNPTEFWIPHQGVATNWEVIQCVGEFNENLKIAADYDWLRRAILESGEPLVLDDYLVVQLSDGISNAKSYTGYLERVSLTREIGLKVNHLPLFLLVKMRLKEAFLSNPRLQPLVDQLLRIYHSRTRQSHSNLSLQVIQKYEAFSNRTDDM